MNQVGLSHLNKHKFKHGFIMTQQITFVFVEAAFLRRPEYFEAR